MDAEPSVSLETYEKLIEQKTAEAKSRYRSRKLEAPDSNQLLWTALLPGWTIPLAQASGFPADDVTGYFDNLQKQHIVQKSELRDENDKQQATLYTMDEVARTDLINAYLESDTRYERLKTTLGEIGSSILDATGLRARLNNTPERLFDQLANATPAVARFAVLAAHATNRTALVAEFESRVELAFRRRESAAIRDWINTALPFSSLLLRLGDDSMKQALQRASQRVILLRREETDRRHLTNFYQRDEQLKAFEELMTGDDSSWALHFLGAGGVGKTMLMRKITVDWAKKYDAVAARVDFDYLRAEYPTLDPGMLLWAFSQELRAYANSESIRFFNKADRTFEDLRSQIQSEIQKGVRERATDRREFADAISAYCDALRLIPQRVLLIVDTCEELAKIGMGLTPVQNIHETFRILRALHDGPATLKDGPAQPGNGVPSLRVIFSGRRPLAKAGIDWVCPNAAQLDERPFLKLSQISGFTKPEAESFLRGTLKVDPKLIPAIIKRSPETCNAIKIESTKVLFKRDKKPRFNPYDLKLYADWSKEAPPPTVTQILETPPATQYVELRVIRRLHHESLKEALPAVALLGHFDRRVLQHVFPRKTPDQIEELFELLQQEEWINQRSVQDEAEGSNLILDIEPGIRTRLFVYYKDNAALRDIQPLAAEYLEKLTLEGNPSRHDWSLFDAALTVLEADRDRERVVRWWKQVDALMFANCLPEWIRNVTDRMQNEGGAAARRDPDAPSDVPPESRLRPAVLATYSSALLRSTPRIELRNAWRELKDVWVEMLKSAGTLADQMPELEARARAGFISASLQSGETTLDPYEIRRFWDMVRKFAAGPYQALIVTLQVYASIVAAFEALVEYAETRTWSERTIDPFTRKDLLELERLFAIPRETFKDKPQIKQLAGFALCLLGRAVAVLEPFNHFESNPNLEPDDFYLFVRALDLCEFAKPTPGKTAPWLDWVPPEDIASRVRLEFIRVSGARAPLKRIQNEMLTSASLFDVEDQSFSIPLRLSNVDNDRLHSAYLRLLSAERPLADNELVRYERALAALPDDLTANQQRSSSRRARDGELICNAHRLTPPLFVTVAELRAGRGHADEVLSKLAAVLGSRSKVDYETQLHISRACAQIIGQFRLREVGEKGGHLLGGSRSDVADRALVWKLDAQEGARVAQTIPSLPPELTPFTKRPRPERLEPGDVETLKWLHAIWQTRYVGDEPSATPVLEWARQNLNDEIDFAPAKTSYELLSVQLDCLEALDLATEYELLFRPSKWLLTRLTPKDFAGGGHLSAEQSLRLWLRWFARDRAQVARNPKPPEWILTVLGERRAAEIALHEADLLALRFPERAASLYRQARHWFELVADFTNAFVAVTAEGMCMPGTKAKVLATEATEIFDLLRISMAEPAVELIKHREKPPENWAPQCWRPLLTRYLLLQAAATSKRDIASISSEIIENYLPGAMSRRSDSIDTPVKWSADLATWLTNAVQPPTVLSRFWSATKQVGSVILVLASIFVIIGLLFRAFRWAFSFVVPTFARHNQGLQFVTLALGVTTLTLAIRLVSKVRRQKASLIHTAAESLDLTVSEEAPAEETVAEYSTWKLWLDFALVWIFFALFIGPYFSELVQRWGPPLLGGIVGAAAVLSMIYVFRGRFSRLTDYVTEIFLVLYWLVFTKICKLQLTISPATHESTSTYETPSEVPPLNVRLRREVSGRILGLLLGFSTRELTLDKPIQATGLEPYDALHEEFFAKSVQRTRSERRMLLGLYPFGGSVSKGSALPIRKPQSEFLTGLNLSLLRDGFGSFAKFVRRHPLRVEIDIPEGPANGVCWEAIVHTDPDSVDERDYATSACYRRALIQRRRMRERTKELSGLFFGESELARSLVTSWPKDSFRVASRDVLVEHQPQISIVHLVGGIESSYTSVGIRLEEESARLNTAMTETVVASDSLIRAEDLVRAFPNLQICVLQEEPRPIRAQRLDGDRRDAYSARLFASQIAALGVACVLALPPLDKAWAAELLASFTNVLTRDEISRSELLVTLTAARRRIDEYIREQNVSRETQQELPQDICLYLDTEWNGRLI